MNNDKQVLVYYAEDTSINLQDVEDVLNAEWFDSRAFSFSESKLSTIKDLKFTSTPSYFESLAVTPVTKANSDFADGIIAMSFTDLIEWEDREIIGTSVGLRVSSNLVLWNLTGSLKELIRQIENANIGKIGNVYVVNSLLDLGGYNNACYTNIQQASFAQIQKELLSEESRMKRIRRVLAAIKGDLIHTTSPSNFRSILNAGLLRRGTNQDSCGKCQVINCLSLSDLALSSEEELLKPDKNWWSQLILPWGVNEELNVTVTMIFNRDKLDKSKLQYLQHNKDFLGPPHGRYIVESEVCYCGDIPIDAVDKVLLIATTTEPIEFQICSISEAEDALNEFEKNFPIDAIKDDSDINDFFEPIP